MSEKTSHNKLDRSSGAAFDHLMRTAQHWWGQEDEKNQQNELKSDNTVNGDISQKSIYSVETEQGLNDSSESQIFKEEDIQNEKQVPTEQENHNQNDISGFLPIEEEVKTTDEKEQKRIFSNPLSNQTQKSIKSSPSVPPNQPQQVGPKASLMKPENVGKMYQAQSVARGQENQVYNWTLRSNSDKTSFWWEQGIQITGPTPNEALQISNHVYNVHEKGYNKGGENATVGKTGWELQKPYIRDQGYKAGLYRKRIDGIYFYVFATAGTDGVIDPDAIVDIKQARGKYTQHYTYSVKDAIRISNYMKTLKQGNELTFVGHSLGGGLASINSRVTGHPAITFNAAGLSYNTKKTYGALGKKSQIDAYVIKGEAVDYYQRKIGLKAEGTIHYLNPKKPYYTYESFMKEYNPKDNLLLYDIKSHQLYQHYKLNQRINNHMLDSFNGLLK